MRFEPTIPELERAKTVHALDRAATVISLSDPLFHINSDGKQSKEPHRKDYLIDLYIFIYFPMLLLGCGTERNFMGKRIRSSSKAEKKQKDNIKTNIQQTGWCSSIALDYYFGGGGYWVGVSAEISLIWAAVFRRFPNLLETNAGTVPRLVTVTSSQIHSNSSIILSFDAIWSCY
jgi:hypothetical protein